MTTAVTTGFIVAKAVLITFGVSILQNHCFHYYKFKFKFNSKQQIQCFKIPIKKVFGIKDKKILTRTSKTKIISYFYCGTCPLDNSNISEFKIISHNVSHRYIN